MCSVGARGTLVACKGEHPACTYAALSGSTIAPAKMVRSGTQEQGPQFTLGRMSNAYCSTYRARAPWSTLAHRDKLLGTYCSTCQASAHVASRNTFQWDPMHTCAHISVGTLAPIEMHAMCAPWRTFGKMWAQKFSSAFLCFLLRAHNSVSKQSPKLTNL